MIPSDEQLLEIMNSPYKHASTEDYDGKGALYLARACRILKKALQLSLRNDPNETFYLTKAARELGYGCFDWSSSKSK